MARCCGSANSDRAGVPAYRRILWAVLLINAAMFGVEAVAGSMARSASLHADALDFLGDAMNYGLSLFVAGKALRHRATASIAKGATMGGFGLWVVASSVWRFAAGEVPEAITMGQVGAAALLANAAAFALLWAYRDGDSNMRSVWICSRNDVLGNLAVLAASLGVFGTGRGWPDATVAALMAILALQGAASVLRSAVGEWKQGASPCLLPSCSLGFRSLTASARSLLVSAPSRASQSVNPALTGPSVALLASGTGAPALPPASFGRKLLWLAQASTSVPSAPKCSSPSAFWPASERGRRSRRRASRAAAGRGSCGTPSGPTPDR